jgi:hypothetical protein
MSPLLFLVFASTVLTDKCLGAAAITQVGIDGSNPPGANSWDFNEPKSTLVVGLDTSVVIQWNGETHALYLFKDANAFANCDFTGATQLRAASPNGNVVVPPAADGTTVYYGCNVDSHCKSFGVKRAVKWSSVTCPKTRNKQKCLKQKDNCKFVRKHCVPR